MSRKTSTWPTRIFKSALLPPESEEDRALLDECYDHNRKHFNKLIHIDLSRRAKYREARSRLFPKLAALEPLEHDLSAKLKAARDEVQAAKAKTKKRDVTPELKVKVATIHAELKAMRAALKVERERGSLALDAVIGAVQSETRQRTGDWRFPALVALKARVDELGGALQSQKVDSSKAKLSSAQSRKIQLTIDNANKEWKAERNRCGCEVVKAYHEELERGGGEICSILAKVPEETLKFAVLSTELVEVSKTITHEAHEAVKALRSTIYWGDYLLIETQAASACKGAADPKFNEKPLHLLPGRLGVHMDGGLGVEELGTNTLMQISPIPTWKERYAQDKRLVVYARGKAARTVLRFRVGSTGKRGSPVWVTFPMVMHRPFPSDARIKDAYVTRVPHSARVPWKYSLCVVLESKTFEQCFSTAEQQGTSTINFGWRLIDGELRVATVNNDVRGISEVRLPRSIREGFEKCESLQGILDRHFDKAKAALALWIRRHEAALSEAFLREFHDLPKWKSQYRLAELARYWKENRVPGDHDIYPVIVENKVLGENKKGLKVVEDVSWFGRYVHLTDWMKNSRQHLYDWRMNFYRNEAKRIACTSAKMVIDEFEISDVARLPVPEVVKTGGDAARTNRVQASPSELRNAIRQAAAKYHCEIVKGPTAKGTRRCNACGFIHTTSIKKLNHVCEGCSAKWDQDVNNTENLHDAHANGNVASFVVPAKMLENGEVESSEVRSSDAARDEVDRLLKTQ